MLKRFKPVSVMLLLMGASSSLGAAYAAETRPNPDDIKINQQTGACTGIVKDDKVRL